MTGLTASSPANLALHDAIQRGSLEDIGDAIRAGADIDAQDKHGATLLHKACLAGDEERVDLLLAMGADGRIRDNFGYTPLHYVCRGYDGSPETDERLSILTKLVDTFDIIDGEGLGRITAVEVAASVGSVSMTFALIEAGANTEVRCGDNVVHIAASQGHSDLVHELLNYGFDSNAVNKDGMTPLHRATEFHHIESVKVLLNRSGVEVNALSEGGRTSLHIACEKDQEAICNLLLDAGAEPFIKDNEGRTALQRVPAGTEHKWEELRKCYAERDRQALTASLESTFNLPPQQRSQSSRQRL